MNKLVALSILPFFLIQVLINSLTSEKQRMKTIILSETEDPPVQYSGTLTIQYTLKRAYPSFESPEQMTEEHSTYTGTISLTSCPGCIDKLKTPSVLSSIIENQTDYGILYGKTAVTESGKRSKTTANKRITESSTRFGSFLSDSEQIISSESNGGEIRFSIQPYIRLNSEGLPALDTQVQYCMVISMGHSNDIYTNPESIDCRGNGKVTERMDAERTETRDMIFNQGFFVGGFTFEHRQGEQSSDRIIIPIGIENPESLEKYIKNPDGTYTMQLQGKYYENNGEEIQKFIQIQMSFSVEK